MRSFRDPSGTLISVGGRILRLVNAAGAPDLNAFLSAPSGRRLLECGRVAGTRVLGAAERQQLPPEACPNAGMVLEHERIPFPSYPYEWPAEMLYAAGRLTLELALELLPDGLGLKDATPYNVLFRGPEPVFIDVLSFERREPDDATWLAYAQFVRTFLLPLLADKHFGLPLEQTLAGRRDGLEPEEVYGWLGPLARMRPPFLSLVSLPTWLAARHNPDDPTFYRKRPAGDPEKARFVLESLLKRLGRTLERVRPRPGRASAWSDYMQGNSNYTARQFAAKTQFVEQAVKEHAPETALDVGCNTGHFSSIAARAGARVVAIDSDPVVVGELWRRAQSARLDILPLVVDLTRPTPGIGWRNQECPSFLERAAGGFDAVFLLAILHHMLVTERIPLEEILQLAAGLTTGVAVIEFIGPEDSMFRRLVRGRESLHRDLSPALFEQTCGRHFEILRRQRLEGSHRWLYLLRKT